MRRIHLFSIFSSKTLNREDTETWTLTTLHVLRFYDKMTIILRPKVHRSITHSNYLVTVKTQFIIHIHTRMHARATSQARSFVYLPTADMKKDPDTLMLIS